MYGVEVGSTHEIKRHVYLNCCLSCDKHGKQLNKFTDEAPWIPGHNLQVKGKLDYKTTHSQIHKAGSFVETR